ncbi:cytochrome P450 [Aspergillus steynii IBT 23096]|uniref:Cytochrome P450 n=1 Tax=Aspergillus steynii IBT 23096 TaxID=1392250 RepID=A0A2I2G8A5_9EURO|nr:cytochrome P450 [Aspergillus steynii IBT 23096]PLB49117.1 cytochrome P450 [Aspergillus steynii IBT 23096]
MIQAIASVLVGVVLLAYVTEYLLSIRDDPREPIRLRPKVPVIGHILGLIRNGPSYHSQLRTATDQEIFTLGIFNFKLYTSVSTRLLPAIQRQSKTLSFRPLIQHVARRWGDASDQTNEIFGGPHLVTNFSHAMKLSLAPGPHLDAQNERMGKRALVDIDALLGPLTVEQQGMCQIKLLEWVRHAIMQASSCGVYGTEHPFLDVEVEKAFWTWHAHLSAHISGLNFDLLGKGYAARQKVFDAHVRYCRNVPSDASPLFTERWRVLQEAGISEADCIKQQATLPIGMLSNTVPTFYWTIWELFSRRELLREVRQELEAQAIIKQDDGYALDVGSLKSKCPLLLSVFQETQRVRHIHAAIRRVMKDTLLDGKYFLREGNYLQMPGHSIHSNTNIWGPSAREFDPYRFIKAAKPAGSDFLAWGAPPHLCPARQFAATEILIMVALLVMRADLEPVSGAWEASPALDFNDPVTVLNPKKEVQMHVSIRGQWTGKWVLHMSPSQSRVPLASG